MAAPLYANALISKLRCITPPLDEEEENKESRLLEAQAREELEGENCPPCYPPHLDIPLRNTPEEYQAIITYWQSFPGTGDVVLRTQLSDWRKFCVFRRKIRAYYGNKAFSSFVDEVRERRRRHGVGGDVRLLMGPEQQSRLENWMEFQNYHLKRLEGFWKKRDKLEKELDDARKKAEVSERAAEDAEAVRQELKNAERDLERHEVLLQWIEQVRQTMDIGYPTPTEEDNYDRDTAPNAVRRTSTRDSRTRRVKAPAVLGKVRITKAKPKKRNMQVQKPKALEFEPAIQDSNVTRQKSNSQTPRRRETWPRRTKEETPLGQIRPQRVSKAKRFTGAGAKSLSGTQRRGAGQTRSLDRARSKRRPAPQRPQPAPENVTTRTGRISRPPVRWAPE